MGEDARATAGLETGATFTALAESAIPKTKLPRRTTAMWEWLCPIEQMGSRPMAENHSESGGKASAVSADFNGRHGVRRAGDRPRSDSALAAARTQPH